MSTRRGGAAHFPSATGLGGSVGRDDRDKGASERADGEVGPQDGGSTDARGEKKHRQPTAG